MMLFPIYCSSTHGCTTFGADWLMRNSLVSIHIQVYMMTWGTKPMMRRSLDIFMARPFTHTCPEMVPYFTVPINAFRNVVLPAPLGPITAATCATYITQFGIKTIPGVCNHLMLASLMLTTPCRSAKHLVTVHRHRLAMVPTR